MEPKIVTMDNVDEFVNQVFAPWVKAQGLQFLDVREGYAKARLPQDPQQQFFSGATCGQALMSAIDTTMVIAMSTTHRSARGTQSQSTRFLRPAAEEDLIVEAQVKKWGRSSYGDVHVWLEGSGELVAHATCEFAF